MGSSLLFLWRECLRFLVSSFSYGSLIFKECSFLEWRSCFVGDFLSFVSLCLDDKDVVSSFSFSVIFAVGWASIIFASSSLATLSKVAMRNRLKCNYMLLGNWTIFNRTVRIFLGWTNIRQLDVLTLIKLTLWDAVLTAGIATLHAHIMPVNLPYCTHFMCKLHMLHTSKQIACKINSTQCMYLLAVYKRGGITYRCKCTVDISYSRWLD